MSSYESRVINFIRATSEEELQKKLINVALQLGQKLEVVNVYHRSNSNTIVAWYFHDIKIAPLPKEDVPVKKVPKRVRAKNV